MICISETYLDSSLANDDPRLNSPTYKVVRADNPNNTERSGGDIPLFKGMPLIRSLYSK